MIKIKSIFLLLVIGITFLPWQVVCLAHPFGHDHHEHEGPSLCEQRNQHKGDAPVFWPPMDCENILAELDEFQKSHLEEIVPSIQLDAFAAVLLEIPKSNYEIKIFFIQPEPRCRSATLLSSLSLRGPPHFFIA